MEAKWKIVLEDWRSKSFYYITPVNIRKEPGAKRVKVQRAASSLTCIQCDDLNKKPDCDFSYTDIDTITEHDTKTDVITELKEMLEQKVPNLQDIEAEILACQAQVAKRRGRLRAKSMRNEATVRYVYGDSIVEMIIDAFGYSLEIEETVDVEQSLVTVSGGSRTDYCCWRLYKQNKSACIVVLETKHVTKIQPQHYAQVLGYYCSNKAAVNHTGIAILLNGYDDKVTVQFFLFPYASSSSDTNQTVKWGLQSLLLPEYNRTSSDVTSDRTFFELIYLFCKDCDTGRFKLTCPEQIVSHDQVEGVFTDQELLKELEERCGRLEQEYKRREQEYKRREQEYKRREQEYKRREQEYKREYESREQEYKRRFEHLEQQLKEVVEQSRRDRL